MKKALPNTKVTVKLRKSNYKDEWYLIIESYPVYKRGSKRASRLLKFEQSKTKGTFSQ